ncbi:MAG: dihydropteroate synthase [Leptolyngbya sp. PLA3]|nr:MAG: dihydropteroate synthase [Cyanobacteria bacterium CYA]MCE7969412.1 dihydropteroate synthase [Leptolyngbya sp. PL-A3]
MSSTWTFAGRSLALDRPRVMAILNVTPDSFFDGGVFTGPEAVVKAARRAQEEGADLLDIGGESTRPGAQRVGADEQIRRVVPAIQAIRAAGIGLPISVDTTRAAVAQAAAAAGAEIINDVSGGEEDPDLLALAGERGLGLVLMHRLSPPERDSYSDRYAEAPRYADVVDEVRASLARRVAAASAAGVPGSAVLVDPGLGFGKSVEQNVELVRGTGRLLGLGAGVLSAASRKSFVGRLSLGRDSQPGERLAGSIAFSLMHLKAGARVFRVHDVGEQGRALRVGWLLMETGDPGMGG